MIDLDLNIVLPSVLVAIPATIAAAASLHNARKIRTNHGSTIGEHVENQGVDLLAVRTDLLSHTEQDQRNFDSSSRRADQIDIAIRELREMVKALP